MINIKPCWKVGGEAEDINICMTEWHFYTTFIRHKNVQLYLFLCYKLDYKDARTSTVHYMEDFHSFSLALQQTPGT